MRISLTADPVEEVYFAQELLAAVGLRKNGPNVVSCATCGRTEVDLEKIAHAPTDAYRRFLLDWVEAVKDVPSPVGRLLPEARPLLKLMKNDDI